MKKLANAEITLPAEPCPDIAPPKVPTMTNPKNGGTIQRNCATLVRWPACRFVRSATSEVT
jgi:hypothetical protein